MLTTDISCLKDIDAEAVLKLQAGFRPYFARNLDENDKTFLECLLDAIESHASDTCSELGIHSVDLIDWKNALFDEIKRLLLIESAQDKGEARPITGNINFDAAGKAFKRAHRDVVIRKIDKAANCLLCVMCKACYTRVATAELNGSGYI